MQRIKTETKQLADTKKCMLGSFTYATFLVPARNRARNLII